MIFSHEKNKPYIFLSASLHHCTPDMDAIPHFFHRILCTCYTTPVRPWAAENVYKYFNNINVYFTSHNITIFECFNSSRFHYIFE